MFARYIIAKNYGIEVFAGSSITVRPLQNDYDADGDALTITRVWKVDAGNRALIDLHDPTSLTFTAGADYLGNDFFFYEVGDGRGGTATSSIEITVLAPAANSPPTVTINNQALSLDDYAWMRLDAVLSVDDANGDDIATFRVWDGEGGHNWWADGGVVDASSGYITGDLSGVWFRRDAEASTQTLWVQAHDGTEWGAWDSFDLVTA